MSAKRCMQQVAATVQASRFELFLDKLGRWPNSRVLWLGASETPDALQALTINLITGLHNCGYRPETRPFQPHLTLMRKAPRVKTLPSVVPVA